MARLAELNFTKGHGTANDFILVPDPDNMWQPTVNQVAWLCDRRRGLGADGVIRVVPTRFMPEYPDLSVAPWFMDYRNADGSVAEMCGNGARVFARYLVASGLESEREFIIATRAGLHQVRVHPDFSVSVSMGQVAPRESEEPISIAINAEYGELPAYGCYLPNPHAVVFLPESTELSRVDISNHNVMPDSAFPDGVNVEFAVVRGDHHIEMRVIERGSGETQSCGTGACAVAWADMIQTARPTTYSREGESAEWRIDVPGGTLWVSFVDSGVWLRGPADLVARGKVLIPAELL